MYQWLQVVHLLMLLVIGANSLTPGIVFMILKRNSEEQEIPLIVFKTLRVLGLLSLTAIIILCTSGLTMYQARYAGSDLGPIFTYKMAAAIAMLMISMYLNLIAYRAARRGERPKRALVKRLRITFRLLTISVVASAVLIFN